MLSPVLIPIAGRHWKLFLIVTALIQLTHEGLRFLMAVGVDSTVLQMLIRVTPQWFMSSRIFVFTLGVVFGLHSQLLQVWLQRAKWWLLGLVVLTGLFSTIEYQWINRLSGQSWLGPNNPGFVNMVYASTFSLCFLAFDGLSVPFARALTTLGTKSLGIYLLNIPVIYPVAVLMYHFTPWVLANQLVYQTVLIASGLGGPLLIMYFIRHSPGRRVYRYLFG